LPQTPGASQLTLVENFETNLFSDEPSSPDTIGRVECSQPMLTTSSGCTLHASVDSQGARSRVGMYKQEIIFILFNQTIMYVSLNHVAKEPAAVVDVPGRPLLNSNL
jgi:hypothetical protein